MKTLTVKTLFRSIKGSLGRFFAILAIIALGVGFFTGLRNAEPAMRATANTYLKQYNLYDFQLSSSLGFTDDDVVAFSETANVCAAEGVYRSDALISLNGADSKAYSVMSVPEKISTLSLVSGRMPENESECIVDYNYFSESDIGKKMTVTDGGSGLSVTEFTIVGTARSPRYLSADRGTVNVGSGTSSGFIYVSVSAFDMPAYYEVLIDADIRGDYFSQEYEDALAEIKPSIESLLSERAEERYNQLVEAAGALGSLIREPVTFVFDATSNVGYANFKNDTMIIDGISGAFPVFFVVIAILVCLVTMARMVNEERTQIGTLKALGYRDAEISMKYVLYSVIASLLGCVAGFFLGTSTIPMAIWSVYGISYGFSDLEFYFSPLMCFISLAVAVFGSLAVTLITCGRELKEKPAELMRPKAPDKGKRIFLENVTPVWKRMSFLSKVTLRNAFRYKKRLAMMLVGIAGCTALLVTGLGVNDSVAYVAEYQYQVHLYDGVVYMDVSGKAEVEEVLNEYSEDFAFAYREETGVISDGVVKNANVIALAKEKFPVFFNLHAGENKIAYPKDEEAVLSEKLADTLKVKVGDVVRINFAGGVAEFTVSGICDNYLNHYAYVSPSSVPGYVENSAFYTEKSGENATEESAMLSAKLTETEGVNYVSLSATERETMENSMSNMSYIVVIIIICAAALAFIVLYNLTNINIMERMREVATVKVLGFYPFETSSYVLRENVILAFIGGIIGLICGKFLHLYVMNCVQVDMFAFDIKISWYSYLIALACTVLFAVITNLFMRIKLEKIKMAESLKSVE